MWAWPFFRKIIIIVLVVWNVVLILIVIGMRSQLSFAELNINLITQNQRQIGKALPIVVRNQESLMYICAENVNMYYTIQDFFYRFHKDAEEVCKTKELYRRCYEQDN